MKVITSVKVIIVGMVYPSSYEKSLERVLKGVLAPQTNFVTVCAFSAKIATHW